MYLGVNPHFSVFFVSSVVQISCRIYRYWKEIEITAKYFAPAVDKYDNARFRYRFSSFSKLQIQAYTNNFIPGQTLES